MPGNFLKQKSTKIFIVLTVIFTFVSLIAGYFVWQQFNNADIAKAAADTLPLVPGQSKTFMIYYGNELEPDPGTIQGLMEVRIGNTFQVSKMYDVFDTDFDGDYQEEAYYELCLSQLKTQNPYRKRMLYIPRSADSTTQCSGQYATGNTTSDLKPMPLPQGEIITDTSTVPATTIRKGYGAIKVEGKLADNVLETINPETEDNYKFGDILQPDTNFQGLQAIITTTPGNGDYRKIDSVVKLEIAGNILALTDLGNFVCKEQTTNNQQIKIGNIADCTAPINSNNNNFYTFPDVFQVKINDATNSVTKTACTINNNGTPDSNLRCLLPTAGATPNATAPVKVTIDTTTDDKGTANLINGDNPVLITDPTGGNCVTSTSKVIIGQTFDCTYDLPTDQTFTNPTVPIYARVLNPDPLSLSPVCTLTQNNTKLECKSIPTTNGTPGIKDVELVQGDTKKPFGKVELINPDLVLDDIQAISCLERIIGQTTNCTITMKDAQKDYTVPDNFAVKVGNSNPLVCTSAGANIKASFACNNVPTLNAAENSTLPADVDTFGIIGQTNAVKGKTKLNPVVKPVTNDDIKSLNCTPTTVTLENGIASVNCNLELKAPGVTGAVTVRLGDPNNNTGNNCLINITDTQTTGTCPIQNINKTGVFVPEAFVNPNDPTVKAPAVTVNPEPVETKDILNLVCNPTQITLNQGETGETNCEVTIDSNNKQGEIEIALKSPTNTNLTCVATITLGNNKATCKVSGLNVEGSWQSSAKAKNDTATPKAGNVVTVSFLPVMLDDLIYLVPYTNITFNPAKNSNVVFGKQDLTVTVNHDVNITDCSIRIRLYGSSNEWTNLPTQVNAKACTTTFPINQQLSPKWDLEIRLTGDDNKDFGSDPSYFFNYGALSVTTIEAVTL
jgi:hypothetical protein